MKPGPATPFAPVLAAVEDGYLVRAEVECLPGPGAGPAGMATVEGVVVEVLKDVGDPDGLGRYFRSLRLRRDGTDYRLDYRGTAQATATVRQYAGEDAFDSSDLWGRRRRVYALEVEGDGITTRRERAGHSFAFRPTDT